MEVDLYFTDYFEVDPDVLEEHGAFDISVVSDLPLFIDPFLLFNSRETTYQQLHQQILDYLLFLRDRAAEQDLDPKLIDAWYRFKEVKQNWLGFTLFGNDGAGLGKDFAQALHSALSEIFADFGNETATRGTHLWKRSPGSGGCLHQHNSVRSPRANRPSTPEAARGCRRGRDRLRLLGLSVSAPSNRRSG